KSKANVISLEEAKLDIFTQLSSLRASIFAAEAELAERRAELELAERRLGIEGQSNALTNGLESSQIEYADEKIDTYKTLTAKLAELQSREYDLLLGNYAETSRSVVLVRQ